MFGGIAHKQGVDKLLLALVAFRPVGKQAKEKASLNQSHIQQAKAGVPGSAAAERAVLRRVARVRTERRGAAAGARGARPRVG